MWHATAVTATATRTVDANAPREGRGQGGRCGQKTDERARSSPSTCVPFQYPAPSKKRTRAARAPSPSIGLIFAFPVASLFPLHFSFTFHYFVGIYLVVFSRAYL